MQPKVSVCCSVLNQSGWLKEMIASVLAQTMKDFELIVVDDGSTEDIRGVVDSFSDERIRFFQFERNLGIPHGMNYAFEMAQGDYIKPMAADELLWPMALELQSKNLDEHPRIAACFGLPHHGALGLRQEYEQYALDAQNRSRAQWLDTLLNLRNVPLGSCNALWRRSLFDEIGVFDPNFVVFCDHEWYCRLVKRHDIWMLPYRVASFRDDPNSVSMCQASVQGQAEQLAKVRAKHEAAEEFQGEPLVTIGIPVKNMPVYVLEAIKSVIAQTYREWELLIVDDGSTDNTYEVILAFLKEANDYRIRLIRFPENKGDREACNYMVAEARGDYFAALSADDILEPTYLSRVLQILQANPLLDFCSTQTDFIGPDGSPFAEDHPFKAIEKAANKSQEQWKARWAQVADPEATVSLV